MVSLDARSEYIKQFESDDISLVLISFLQGKDLKVTSGLPLSNANNILIYVLKAIQKDDPKSFTEAFNQINRRQPSSDTDWIYNDVLLFALIIGVCKFGHEKKWLLDILRTRNTQTQNEKELITQTFTDVLKGNFDSNDNVHPLMLVMKHYLHVPLDDSVLMNTIYEELLNQDFPCFKAPFLNLVSLKAFDVILLAKGLADGKRRIELDKFVESYEKRVLQMATIIWIICLIIILAWSVWVLYYYFNAPPQQADFIGKMLTILPYIGIGSLLPLITSRKKIIELISNLFHWFYKYNINEFAKP